MGINWYTWQINYELEQMSRYLDLIQSSLGQRFDEIEKAYHKDMAREMSENEYSRVDDHYTDEFFEVGRDFPQRLLASFIVTWYSFVEQKLLDLCEELELMISIGPKDNTNLGKGIRRARRFLLEAKQYEIHPPHWQELTEIGKLRNFIVHRGTKMIGSYFPSDDNMITFQSDMGNTIYFLIAQDLYQYMHKHQLVNHSGIFLDIIPPFEYCTYLVEFGKKLFSKLYKDLKPGRL
ncbi:MAG: hypothetical protein GY845_39385 [Planctomycetes bacterium]|nr:hypothetical protein [Planctomycetota bacterium]